MVDSVRLPHPTPAAASLVGRGADHVIVFTRYPEPGRTKTRLIPALGAAGAAEVQRRMTEQMMRQVARLQQLQAVQVTVQFAGGDRPSMQAWLGDRWDYCPQADGDLGDRLTAAMEQAFAAGAKRVLMVGIDCPTLDATLLLAAFESLNHQDVVIGPAEDGGYYLIGMHHPLPALFQGITWSTAVVRQQTEAIAQHLRQSVGLLPPQTDVDLPENLGVWDAVRQNLLSVIIPVLNEAETLPALLDHLRQTPTVEVLLVDGGSHDATVAIAQSYGVSVLHSAPGRALQMNQGAAAATGGRLLFLHADTRLPPNFPALAEQTLAQPGVVAGAFELAIAAAGWGYRWVEWGVKWRSRLYQLPYGDQALFLSAETFRAIGGFSDLPIMEDLALVRTLKQRGKVAIAPAAVCTSARRWQTLGLWQTTLLNQAMLLGYALGRSPQKMAHSYRQPSLASLLAVFRPSD